MSLTIVEGVDGSGKSTLIKGWRSSKLFYFHTLASTGPPPKREVLQAELAWLARLPRSITLICDRHRLISEPIYGPILRGRSMLGLEKTIGETLIDLGAQIVYCRPTIEVIVENVRASQAEQLDGVWDHLAELVEAYDRTMDELSNFVSVFEYNYHLSSPARIAAQLGVIK